ncbi:MAG: hypothetical protein B6229_06415 [Spirochaetaceae bacterium 4572_7]|nr:MAG: hypothetical protein B6229_06415 [Spirochaetaceae bacterium 4572_7]
MNGVIIGYKNKEVVIDVEELSPGIIIIRPTGVISSKNFEQMCSFLTKYSKKIGERITVLYNISEIKSIPRDSLLWLIRNTKNGLPIKNATSFGENPFIQNLIQIVMAVILRDDNIHQIFRNREEAILYLGNDILNLTPSS